MHFPYREIEPGKLGPIVNVRLFAAKRFFLVEAFIDSGADFSVFDVETARLIGLNYRSGKRIPITVGDGDRMVTYLQRVPVVFAGHRFTVPICFSESLGAGFNLIGRAGFFEHFRICFHEKRRFVSIVRA